MQIRSRRLSRGVIAGLTIASVGLAMPMSSGAQESTAHTVGHTTKSVSFSGSCSFDNASLVLSPGLAIKELKQTGNLSAKGSCSGSSDSTLTGTIMGTGNCTGGDGAFDGTGTLTVNGTAIPVKLVVDVTLPTGKIVIDGTSSGTASGAAKFLNGSNLGEMPSCAGHGLQNVTFDSSVSTSSAVTSTVSVPTPPKKKVTKKKKKH